MYNELHKTMKNNKEEYNTMKQIIIDNDGGTDDYVAILYAFLSKKFDVKGITLVAGNTSVLNVRDNTFKALEMAGVTPEEAEKMGIYLPERVNANRIPDDAHGENGLGNVKYTPAVGYKVNPDQTAEDKLINLARENPGEISIVATGPLTNIASAIDKDPNFVKNVKEIIIMGGDEGGGNITPYAEFNIYQDPEAAKKVFEAGFKKIVMIGFNVTKQITFCPEVEEFIKAQGEYGKFLYDITRVTADLDRGKNRVDGASMNDILTLMYLLDDGMLETKKASVTVDTSDLETRGQTVIGESGNVDVVTRADGTRLIREMLVTLFPGKEKEIEEVLAKRQERIDLRDFLLKSIPDYKDKILQHWNGEHAVEVMRQMKDIIEVAKQRAKAKSEKAKNEGEER